MKQQEDKPPHYSTNGTNEHGKQGIQIAYEGETFAGLSFALPSDHHAAPNQRRPKVRYLYCQALDRGGSPNVPPT